MKANKLFSILIVMALVSTAYAADFLCCGARWGMGKDEVAKALAKAGVKPTVEIPDDGLQGSAYFIFFEDWRGANTRVNYIASEGKLSSIGRKVPFKSYAQAEAFYSQLVKEYNSTHSNTGSNTARDGKYKSFENMWEANGNTNIWAVCCRGEKNFEVYVEYSELARD